MRQRFIVFVRSITKNGTRSASVSAFVVSHDVAHKQPEECLSRDCAMNCNVARCGCGFDSWTTFQKGRLKKPTTSAQPKTLLFVVQAQKLPWWQPAVVDTANRGIERRRIRASVGGVSATVMVQSNPRRKHRCRPVATALPPL